MQCRSWNQNWSVVSSFPMSCGAQSFTESPCATRALQTTLKLYHIVNCVTLMEYEQHWIQVVFWVAGLEKCPNFAGSKLTLSGHHPAWRSLSFCTTLCCHPHTQGTVPVVRVAATHTAQINRTDQEAIETGSCSWGLDTKTTSPKTIGIFLLPVYLPPCKHSLKFSTKV